MEKYVKIKTRVDDQVHHSTKVNAKLDDLKIFEYFRALFDSKKYYIVIHTYFEEEH